MNFKDFDYVDSDKFSGKIILTSFPGLNQEGKFDDTLFLLQLGLFQNNNCASIVSFVEDKEFDSLSGKDYFVKKVYQHKLHWHHLPISDLNAPNHEFKLKWETTKVLLKNELMEGKNIILHCRGGKGRAGTAAAILLVDFGYGKQEAIDLVRERRKGAIETEKQKDFVLSYRAVN
ncbi:MAG: hypothetical protein CMD59_06565 [Gammaproteobacteria bacterium]|nr:hypothetical protein [Gammaproteobacteria bacterium]|tara:strand:- start:1027 stop:1551 length:525 start_codon:yes stop_codon:yes gene_type:complete